MTESDPPVVPHISEAITPPPISRADASGPPKRTAVRPVPPMSFSLIEARIRDEIYYADPPRSWFWGLFEAAVWWFGTLWVHVIGGIAVAILVITYKVQMQVPKPFDVTDPASMAYLTGGEMLLFVLAAILAVALRYWGSALRELNFSKPDLRHIVIVLAMTLPLSMAVSVFSLPIQMAWQALGDVFPVLKFIDGLNVMEAVQDMSDNTSLSTMIFVIAVLPAIGEELVFRGAIGRILISDLGLWGGVLVTSFLFGWMHIHPVHAMAVIPLGIVIHVVYLWTRSFWMPMLLHFANNTWASVAATLNTPDPMGQMQQLGLFDLLEMVTGGVVIGALATCLWQSRVQFYLPDGQIYESSRFPVRVPAIPGIQSLAGTISPVVSIISVLSVVVYYLIFFLNWPA
ncbi:lysostaphin resistance A-like protein [Schlesneria sp. T3-172]|uniref:CPBP family intramembrane glutamic endopeptidase n=1 Tax=Schlesneria sphaerica TaxID=3373610 RepID=UPI0037CC5220